MGGHIPRGWEAAPQLIAQEIFLVWQEDEMPDELKQAPGYAPFTLSSDGQSWVDSMAEIQEFQDGKIRRVIGRPKPLVERQRRQLAEPPPPQAPRKSAPPTPPKPAPREPPRTMPDVKPGYSAPPLPAAPARATIHPVPAIGDRPPIHEPNPARAAPEIGGVHENGTDEARAKPRTMPEIGGPSDEPGEMPEKPRPMPDIG